MRFEWDEEKNRRNKLKHGISFQAAAVVFDDPFRKTEDDIVVNGEQRLRTIGMLKSLTIALVIHLTEDEDGEEIIRIISARKAAPHEQRGYSAV